MEQEILKKLQNFYNANKNECLALNNWLKIKAKPFNLTTALECIYKATNGMPTKMKEAITQLTSKKKLQGRANAAYGEENHGDKIDIRKNENGDLELVGISSNFQEPLKGQHRGISNDKIFRKGDDQVNKNYKNTEEKLYDLGTEVRRVFPTYNNVMLTQLMIAIREYATLHKLNPLKVIKYIEKGRLNFNEDNLKVESINHNKVIVITEAMAEELNNKLTMTEYKFNCCIKKYLHDLLVDPVNAQVPSILSYYGYNRYKLINLLRNNGMLLKDEQIIDKDENGMDKTATMKVKYKVPKKNFDRKLRNLYIKMFEKNIPEKHTDEIVTEDGEGAAMGTTNASSSGQYSQPLFPLNRRTMYGDVDEDTTTTSVGNYQYDVPFGGDKETLARKNGVGGSVSINKA